jgi:23S rRNA (guanosine2251-2'-O)-methyltransferase
VTRQLEMVYGRHSVRAVFLTRPFAVKRVVILEGRDRKTGKYNQWTEEYLELTRQANVEPLLLLMRDFLRVTGLQENDNHQGICVFVEPHPIYDEGDLGDLATCHLVLALDKISNPQNLATILRSSAFFGVDALILLRHSAAQITPEVVRFASGGAEFMRIYEVTNLAQTIKSLKDLGYWIYGLDERGPVTIWETNFADRTTLVMGAEGEGLRRLTKENCDYLVSIPGRREGLESLNVGVATSIALAEIRHSQSSPKK